MKTKMIGPDVITLEHAFFGEQAPRITLETRNGKKRSTLTIELVILKRDSPHNGDIFIFEGWKLKSFPRTDRRMPENWRRTKKWVGGILWSGTKEAAILDIK